MKKKGRPSKLTEEVIVALCGHIRKCLGRADACALEGIGLSTFKGWLQKFPHFSDRIKKAEMEAKEEALSQIQKAGKRSWPAFAWLLERKWPEEFAKREKQDVNLHGKDGGPVQIEGELDLSKLTDEELYAYRAVLRKAKRGD